MEGGGKRCFWTSFSVGFHDQNMSSELTILLRHLNRDFRAALRGKMQLRFARLGRVGYGERARAKNDFILFCRESVCGSGNLSTGAIRATSRAVEGGKDLQNRRKTQIILSGF